MSLMDFTDIMEFRFNLDLDLEAEERRRTFCLLHCTKSWKQLISRPMFNSATWPIVFLCFKIFFFCYYIALLPAKVEPK